MTLTPKQRTALQLIANGAGVKVAAHQMGVTYGAFGKRLSKIRRALHAADTTHAVAEALRRGLIE